MTRIGFSNSYGPSELNRNGFDHNRHEWKDMKRSLEDRRRRPRLRKRNIRTKMARSACRGEWEILGRTLHALIPVLNSHEGMRTKEEHEKGEVDYPSHVRPLEGAPNESTTRSIHSTPLLTVVNISMNRWDSKASLKHTAEGSKPSPFIIDVVFLLFMYLWRNAGAYP